LPRAISVEDFERDEPGSFPNHVLPVLTKILLSQVFNESQSFPTVPPVPPKRPAP
jgi:hypothetical protein